MARLATVAAFGFEDFHPPTLLAIYRSLGCASLQYYRNPNKPVNVAEALAVAGDLGLPFDSIHGLFGPQLDPSSPEEAVRQFAIETYRREGELARSLGGPAVVVHPGPPSPQPVSAANRAARAAALRRSLEQLARIGEEQGVTFLMENLPGAFLFGDDTRELAAMVRGLDHRNVGMCFDTGHAHLTTGASVAVDLAACRDVVSYLHVSDNRGDADSHLAPGEGSIDWPAVAAQIMRLPPSAPAMLELFYREEVLLRLASGGFAQRVRCWLGIAAAP